MKENIITFELAKLFKKADFVDAVDNYYMSDGTLLHDYNIVCDRNSFCEETFSAPTLYHAQKWLRENYGMYVIVTEDFYTDGVNHLVQVLTYDKREPEVDDIDHDCIDHDLSTMTYGDNAEFDTYEDALNFGLYQAILIRLNCIRYGKV